jgi:hypothetical protein
MKVGDIVVTDKDHIMGAYLVGKILDEPYDDIYTARFPAYSSSTVLVTARGLSLFKIAETELFKALQGE